MDKQKLIEHILKSDLTALEKRYLEELVKSASVGRWDCVNNGENIYMCTSCGDAMALEAGMSPEDYGFDFCPYCGAKMDEN